MKGWSVRRITFTFMFLHAALCLSLFLFQPAFSQEKAPPKLVVGIVIDQFRYDYLAKNKNLFTKKGFRFLQENGVSYTNAHYPYVPTYTAPGHASIYTGSSPAYHGIVANDWYERFEKKEVYCVDDDAVQGTGSEGKAGKKSPRRLIGNTIGDELLDFTNGKAKVISIAMKDRSAILPAGKAGKAFWFDDETGFFITSTYYANILPQWVQNFNAKKPAEEYLSAQWTLLHPESDYALSDPDDSEGEGTLYGETKPVFPHKIIPGEKPAARYSTLKETPFISELTFELAKEAVSGEELGADDVPDLLAISLGANDYVGHTFGPDSREAQDMALRTDVMVADFLEFLDKKIGLANVVFFVTADHGAAPSIAHSQRMKYPVQFVLKKDFVERIESALKMKFGEGKFISDFVNQWFYLNESELNEKSVRKSEFVQELQSVLLQQPEVQYVISAEALQTQTARMPLFSRVQMGYYPQRSGDVYMEMKPFYFFPYKNTKTGGDHGAMYSYDSHVPVIFYGKSIPKKGNVARHITPLDIAPTLSQLLNIPMPSIAVGNVLEEIIP